MTDTIGSRITKAREKADKTKHALAIAVGCYPATLASWETGRVEPRATDVVAIAEACGVDAGWLLTGQGAA